MTPLILKLNKKSPKKLIPQKREHHLLKLKNKYELDTKDCF